MQQTPSERKEKAAELLFVLSELSKLSAKYTQDQNVEKLTEINAALLHLETQLDTEIKEIDQHLTTINNDKNKIEEHEDEEKQRSHNEFEFCSFLMQETMDEIQLKAYLEPKLEQVSVSFLMKLANQSQQEWKQIIFKMILATHRIQRIERESRILCHEIIQDLSQQSSPMYANSVLSWIIEKHQEQNTMFGDWISNLQDRSFFENLLKENQIDLYYSNFELIAEYTYSSQ